MFFIFTCPTLKPANENIRGHILTHWPRNCGEKEQEVQQVPLVFHLLGVEVVAMLSIPGNNAGI